MVTGRATPFKGASPNEKAPMSIKISTIATPLLTVVFTVGASAGCSVDTKPKASARKAQKETKVGEGPDRILREQLLLQLIFDRKKGAAVRQAACQLHLLRDGQGKLRVSADIGDLRRRTVYPQQKEFQRLPTFFPAGLEKDPLWVEVHTSVNGVMPSAIPLRPKQGKLVEWPAKLPSRWAFCCVLRQKDGRGVAIDGMFYGDKATVLGNRALDAKSSTPAAIRKFLAARVAH